MLTLLLDLDDTLLENNMETFLPAYLKALSQQLADVVPANKMITELLTATRLMIANQAVTSTLEEVFDGHFYPAIGSTKEDLRDQLERFYRDEFPKLQLLTRRKADATTLIDFAASNSYPTVVATNPLFPETAVHQRLEWAGFPPAERRFEIITHYSSFHFSKPNPAYYAEILASLGWSEWPAVMVGNELSDDIVPASQLGLPCYWLQEVGEQPLPATSHPLSKTGGYAGLIDWLQTIDHRQPVLELKTPESILAVLRSTPAAIAQWAKSMPITREGWHYRLGEGEWGLVEIICHLRDGDAEVHLPRIRRVIREDEPHLEGKNTDPWAIDRNYRQQSGALALQQFAEGRSRLLQVLDSLKPDDWQRPAVHTIFGPTTLLELAGFIATHDRTHIQQAYRTLQAWKEQTKANPNGRMMAV